MIFLFIKEKRKRKLVTLAFRVSGYKHLVLRPGDVMEFDPHAGVEVDIAPVLKGITVGFGVDGRGHPYLRRIILVYQLYLGSYCITDLLRKIPSAVDEMC